MIKKTVSLVLAAALATGIIPVAASAEDGETASVRFGEYRDERIGELGNRDSKGLLFFPEQEWMYDFDGEELPEGVTVSESNSVEVSGKYYTTPCPEDGMTTGLNKSLKWSTQGMGSILTLDGGNMPFKASLNPDGNRYDWRHVYYLGIALLQEQLPDDGQNRAFEVSVNTNTTKWGPQYTIYLHKDGWNFFSKDLRRGDWEIPSGTVLESITIKQIAGSACDIYVDDALVYVCNAANFTCTPYIEEPVLPSEEDYPVQEPSEAEKTAASAIEKRVMPDLSPVEKLSDSVMQNYREYYQTWNIRETENCDFVNGENPLYYHRAAPGWTPLNDDSYFMNQRNSQLSTQYKNLCHSYNQVRDEEQKAELAGYVVNLSKLALSYGNIPSSWYGGRGFAEGVYYAKGLLEEYGLAEKMSRQIKTQYGTDALLYSEHDLENLPLVGGSWRMTADDLYTAYQSLMISILLESDPAGEVRDLYRLKSYLDNVLLSYSPYKDGTLKPDGSMFHHSMHKYDYGWRDAGNTGLVAYAEWLTGTPFALSEETLERLNHIIEVKYQIIEQSERAGTPDMMRYGLTSKGIRMLAMAGMPDGSMDINPYRAAEWLAYNDADAKYSVNQAIKKQFTQMGILPAPVPQTNATMSYAALNVHRRDDWKVQAYGSSKLLPHNEYGRPATLFYNIAGLALTKENDHPAMLVNGNDNIYGRSGNFNPASGYNFNRAPGVTAPDVDPVKLTSPGSQTGSSDFVGGVSSKNGNGVFTVPFDAKDTWGTTDASKKYQNTPAKDFRFKKSYFCFDDTIVCLASNIGYMHNEEYGGTGEVTTGLFQEKAAEVDRVCTAAEILSADEYVKEYNSNDNPWLIDNTDMGGIYLFPGQKYTVFRGEQTFLYKAETEDFNGKGNYVSAYINHSSDDVENDSGEYAYILVPEATEERMQALTDSMESDLPEIEIVRQDEYAHCVRNNKLNSAGYVFFDSQAKFEQGIVSGVSSPAVILTKEFENGSGCSLAVADPDLRMDKSSENPLGWSQPKTITVTLKGKWALKETADYQGREYDSDVQVTQVGDETQVSLICRDGLTTEVLLENTEQPLSTDLEEEITFQAGSDTALINEEAVKLSCSVRTVDNTAYIALVDLAKVLGAGLSKKTAENRMNLYYRNKKIIFTENSQVGTVDSHVFVLEKEVQTIDGVFSVPVSVLSEMLGAEGVTVGDNITYVRNDAEWKEWDSEPSEPKGFVFTGGDGGERPAAGVNVLTVPDDIKEGIFVFAVYKDNMLKDVQISDVNDAASKRIFSYEITEEAEKYTFKGMLLENLTSVKPLMEREVSVKALRFVK